MSQLDFQPSFHEQVSFHDVGRSVRAGRLDPKYLYATEAQAKLWREVFLRHSPIHQNPEFQRIYDDAFRSIAASVQNDKIWVVGLGPGTGLKEAKIISHLKKKGREVIFSAVDVSGDLVLEATESAANGGAERGNGLVGDLTKTDFLKQWLDERGVASSRLYTFFGLVPNLSPATVIRLFRAVLRTGDALLVSAHLAPVSEGIDVDAAMRKVLPQYDNAETLEWIRGAFRACGLLDHLDDPVMTVGESEGIPAFRAVAMWKSDEPFATDHDVIDPDPEHPFELFRSLRYTPELFEKLLREAGFHFERLAMTACREEAIWVVKKVS